MGSCLSNYSFFEQEKIKTKPARRNKIFLFIVFNLIRFSYNQIYYQINLNLGEVLFIMRGGFLMILKKVNIVQVNIW